VNAMRPKRHYPMRGRHPDPDDTAPMKFGHRFFCALPLAACLSLAACKPSSPPSAATAPPSPSAAAGASAEQRIGDLVITAASTRETAVPGVTAIGFLTIRNSGATDDVLLGGSTSIAGSVEIHEMSMTDGMMRMRALPDGVPIPAGATVQLAAGGTHLMLIDTKSVLTAGSTVELELRFAKAGTGKITLTVEPQAAAGTGDEHAGH